ncbi:MAG TPA: hypothetical protein VHS55_06615 [Solirubrobacteraceae bacterium]|jgi:hypothetical protein|nr:hypothetical protein [Solirubrobacteraceae bacterium]
MAANTPRVARAALGICVIAQIACGPVALARESTPLAPMPGDYSVMVEQCVNSNLQTERSATFVVQMVATVSTQKMAMKINLEERGRSEAEYHVVPAPGFGVWRPSEPGVKIYKYVKQVTNLAAPVSYRVAVKFRWVGDKGRVIKRADLRSSRCFQPTFTAPVRPAAAA